MTENYAADGLFGVMGCPVSHSKSPALHSELAALCGKKIIYAPLHVEPNELENAVKGAFALGFLGLNVTAPHKEAVLPLLEGLSPEAAAIGAANTLIRTKSGFLGHNTDAEGLYRSLMLHNADPEGKTIMLLGAGGAAKAAAYSMGAHKAAKVYIVNRTFEKAKELAGAMFSVFRDSDPETIFVPLTPAESENIPADILINATTLGMKNESELPCRGSLSRFGAVSELIYSPPETPLMAEARKCGIPAFNGLAMLVFQGIASFERWQNINIPKDAALKILFRLAAGGRGIALTGFMGSGKSTFGKALAKLSGMPFKDMDSIIEKEQNRSVSEIFRDDGEAFFRALEVSAAKKLHKGNIIATGGGIVLSSEAMEALAKNNVIIRLKASPESVMLRLKNDKSRPLLAAESEEERKNKIRSLMEAREELYKKYADITLETDGKSPDELINEFIRRFI